MTSYLTMTSPGGGTPRRVSSQTIAQLFAGDDEDEATPAPPEPVRQSWAALWDKIAGPVRDVILLLIEEHRARRLETLG